MNPRLKELYYREIQPSLKTQFGFKNLYMGPKIEKIILNMGLGLDGNDSKILKSCDEDLGKIAGQKPIITKARQSVASFKIREGWPLGCKVTLRGNKMYDFIERLIKIAIPRERDFRGLNPRSFDEQGNYNFGIKEQIIFPEINYDNIDNIRGMDVCINTSAKSVEHAKALLQALEFPFKKR